MAQNSYHNKDDTFFTWRICHVVVGLPLVSYLIWNMPRPLFVLSFTTGL